MHVAYQQAAVVDTSYKNEHTTIELNEVNNESSSSSLKKKEQWRPGFFHQFPWMGFGGLLGVLICTSVCMVIVYVSNGKARSQWKSLAAPNVLISVFTAVASILVTMSVGNGIAISWWRKAMKGSTVEELHASWSFGSSVLSIITGLKFFNVMALAALCTKLAIIDGILFQKALTTQTALGPPRNYTVDTYSFDTLPVTGKLNSFGNSTAEQSFAMTYDTMYWINSDIYTGIDWTSYFVGEQFSGCEGLCGLTYRGFGFSSSCALVTYAENASRNRTAVQAGNDTLLDIVFSYVAPTTKKNYSHIQLDWQAWESYSNGSNNNPNCLGNFYHLQCELRPALVDYPVVLQNTSFSGRSSKGTKQSNYIVKLGTVNESDGSYEWYSRMYDYSVDQQLGNFSVVQYLNVTEGNTPGGNSTLGGIVYALNTYYSSQSVATYQRTTTANNKTSYTPVSSPYGLQVPFAQLSSFNDGCPTGFTSPYYVEEAQNELDYDLMLGNINQLTLLLATDPWLRPDYPGEWGNYDDTYYNYTDKFIKTETMVGLKPEIYYYSKFSFAWGAFASTVIIVLLILPSYWGYWELGRKVTLGPLEIANAFDAPAFQHVDRGTGHVDHVLDAVGQQKVKYDVNGKYGFVHH